MPKGGSMKRLSLIIIASVVAMQVCGDDANAFKNVTAGFEVTKPAGWQFITAEQNLENIKRTTLNDSEFHAAMLKYATAPLVAMTKYAEPFDDVNPSFKVNIKPLGQLKGMAATAIMNLITPQFEKAFKDFVIVE